MVSIRAAVQQDAESIAHVHVQSWITTYAGIVPAKYLASLNEAERIPLWQDWLSRDIRVYVAEKDGGVVGFARLRSAARCSLKLLLDGLNLRLSHV